MKTILVIAGSDSSGGAGLQADLRTLNAVGVLTVCVVTAVTAQNSRRVLSTGIVSAHQVERQLTAVVDGFDIGAVKIGMLGSASNIRAVAKFLGANSLPNIVLDPVLVSSSGTSLLPGAGLKALRDHLIPLAEVLTPNLPEAAALLGRKQSGAAAARRLLDLGAKSVLLKGGHARAGSVVDYFADPDAVHAFRHQRLKFQARGTGCALSSAIAARLAYGDSPLEAVSAAEAILQAELRNSTPNPFGPRLLFVNNKRNI